MLRKAYDRRSLFHRATVLVVLAVILIFASTRMQADTGTCNGQSLTLPFTDVPGSNVFFCSIAQAFFTGLTSGTTATTYSPAANVTREQMAAFITRTMDQSLKRGSQRAVAKKWFTPQDANSLTLTTVGEGPRQVEFDGKDLWVANRVSGSVTRISPGDGKVLDTWTGATNAIGIVCAIGKIFITGQTEPGNLYLIDPTQPAGDVTTLTSSLGNSPDGIAFDGARIWTANRNSVSIVSLNPTSVTTVSPGFAFLFGILYDGANIWVIDGNGDSLHKLNSNGGIAQTITMGDRPLFPVFDGTNVWVPNTSSNSVTVVRVKDAAGNSLAAAFVLATLTGNGLNEPITAAFDGERILVTNANNHSVSLWKAADLTPIGSFPTGTLTNPYGACSDGLNFWITLRPPGTDRLARF